jgi:hypothetical protein
MTEPPDEKRCSRCGELKPRSQFYSKGSICKTCCRPYNVAHERAPQELLRFALEASLKAQAFDRVVIVTIAVESALKFLEQQRLAEARATSSSTALG